MSDESKPIRLWLPGGCPSDPMSDESQAIPLLLDAEYGTLSPLWVEESPLGYVNYSLDAFPLSKELRERLAAWAETYNRTSETDYDWPSEAAADQWVRESWRLLEATRQELGPRYEITHWSDKFGNVESQQVATCLADWHYFLGREDSGETGSLSLGDLDQLE